MTKYTSGRYSVFVEETADSSFRARLSIYPFTVILGEGRGSTKVGSIKYLVDSYFFDYARTFMRNLEEAKC